MFVLIVASKARAEIGGKSLLDLVSFEEGTFSIFCYENCSFLFKRTIKEKHDLLSKSTILQPKVPLKGDTLEQEHT